MMISAKSCEQVLCRRFTVTMLVTCSVYSLSRARPATRHTKMLPSAPQVSSVVSSGDHQTPRTRAVCALHSTCFCCNKHASVAVKQCIDCMERHLCQHRLPRADEGSDCDARVMLMPH